MKKFVALSLSAISLAACGDSNKPETSDVKAFLEPKFQSCKNIKVTNVKKTNGYLHPSDPNVYVVQHSYTIALKNPSDYKALIAAYKDEKVQADAFEAELTKALDDRARVGLEQSTARENGDAKKEAQAERDFFAANDRGWKIQEKRNEFRSKAKVAGNVPFKMSRFYYEGCDYETLMTFIPTIDTYTGRILNLKIKDDSPEWLSIGDIEMTGEIMLRKTDNGWRGR